MTKADLITEILSYDAHANLNKLNRTKKADLEAILQNEVLAHNAQVRSNNQWAASWGMGDQCPSCGDLDCATPCPKGNTTMDDGALSLVKDKPVLLSLSLDALSTKTAMLRLNAYNKAVAKGWGAAQCGALIALSNLS